MNKAASELAKLGRGVPKTLTPEQREAKAKVLASNRKKRWPAKKRRKPNRAQKRSQGWETTKTGAT